MADKPKMYKWSCKTSDGLSIWLQGKHVKAVNKVLTLTEAQHLELQDLIASGRHDISIELVYLDEEAAIKVAEAHLASMRSSAHQGAAHSSANAEKSDGNVVKPSTEENLDNLTPFQRQQKARREGLTTSQPVGVVETPRSMEVVEEDAVHASDVAPASA